MRTFAVLLFTLGCIPFLWTQTRGFNYQAVIRDQNGTLLVNQQKEIEFNFFNKNNALICTQTILVTTNAYGVANTVIDLDACGDLGLTDWLEGGIYLRIVINNGILPDKQLLHYVPYALVADTIRRLPTLAGDVTGAIGANKVSQLQGLPVSPLVPKEGQLFAVKNGRWEPVDPVVVGADGWGNEVVNTDPPLQGTGLANNRLSIAPLGITGALLATQAVSTDKLATDAVSSLKIADGEVKSVDIGTGEVKTDDLADGAVSAAKLQAMGASSAGQILSWNGNTWVAANPAPGADNWGSQSALTSAPLSGDGAGTPIALAPAGITNTYLADKAVTKTKINDGAVGSTQLDDSAVTGAKLADDAVSSAKIANGSIASVDLGALGATTTGQVLSWNGNTWVAANPASGADNWGAQTALTSAPLSGDGAGTPIALAPAGITNTYLADKAVTKTKINDGAVGTAQLDDGAVTGAKLADDAVSSAKIANGSIASADLSTRGATTTGQVLSWNGSAWVAANPASGADNWGAQTALTSAPLSGDGAGTPIALAPAGITNTYLADKAVTKTKINDGAVGVAQLDDGAVTGAKLADDAVSSAKIANGSIAAPDMSPFGATAAGQLLTWNGSIWVADNPAPGADNWGTQSAATMSPLSGNGTTLSPLGLTAGGITNTYLADDAVSSANIANGSIAAPDMSPFGATAAGQLLTWNGSIWVADNPAPGADNWGTQTAATMSPVSGNGSAGSPITLSVGGISTTYLADNAVTSSKIQDGTIQQADLAPGIFTDSWTAGTGNNIYRNLGNVGIGTSTPGARLEVSGNAAEVVKISTSAVSNSTRALSVTVVPDGSASNAAAVYGESVPLNNFGYGGYFLGGRYGVRGQGTIAGVFGSGDIGLEGVGTLTGVHASGPQTGVYASSNSRGVWAVGGTYGIYASGTTAAGYFEGDVEVTGVLSSNVTAGNDVQFKAQHPQSEVWYAALEGPEAAAYERGTATLHDGVASIVFSDHFQSIGNAETMTVILTPLSAASKGLAVIKKDPQGIVVQELFDGKGNYKFDWEVKCVRKGKENYQVMRVKSSPAPAGSGNE